MIRFHCAKCSIRLKVKDELAGKWGKCLQCGAINRVPARGQVSPEDAAEGKPRPQSPQQQMLERLATALDRLTDLLDRFAAANPQIAAPDASDVPPADGQALDAQSLAEPPAPVTPETFSETESQPAPEDESLEPETAAELEAYPGLPEPESADEPTASEVEATMSQTAPSSSLPEDDRAFESQPSAERPEPTVAEELPEADSQTTAPEAQPQLEGDDRDVALPDLESQPTPLERNDDKSGAAVVEAAGPMSWPGRPTVPSPSPGQRAEPPDYGALRLLGIINLIFGWVTAVGGSFAVALILILRTDDPTDDPLVAVLVGILGILLAVFVGIFQIGLGQVFFCVRDIARNSFYLKAHVEQQRPEGSGASEAAGGMAQER